MASTTGSNPTKNKYKMIPCTQLLIAYTSESKDCSNAYKMIPCTKLITHTSESEDCNQKLKEDAAVDPQTGKADGPKTKQDTNDKMESLSTVDCVIMPNPNPTRRSSWLYCTSWNRCSFSASVRQDSLASSTSTGEEEQDSLYRTLLDNSGREDGGCLDMSHDSKKLSLYDILKEDELSYKKMIADKNTLTPRAA